MQREIRYTDAYLDFLATMNDRARAKLLKGVELLRELPVVSTKLAKKLSNTDFYELRISVDNEIRIMLFCIENENLNQAKEVVLLNGFIKKDTKDYKKQIQRAIKLLNELQ